MIIPSGESEKEPSFAEFVRYARSCCGARSMTRQQLAEQSHLSMAYVAKLESGLATSPSPQVLAALANALRLTDAETQHLYDLAGRSSDNVRAPGMAPLSVLEYRALLDPDYQETLEAVTPHLMAVLDERWNVIASNTAYREAYPGLSESANVLSWFFMDPRSRQVMVEWEQEAALTVRWFRALAGRYRNSAWSRSILEQLSGQSDFTRMWRRNEVAFGRDNPWMSLRELRNGSIYHVWVKIYADAVEAHQLQIFTGVRRSRPASSIAQRENSKLPR